MLSNPSTWINAADPRAICRELYAMLLPVYVAKPESLVRFKGDVCSGSKDAVRYQQFVNRQICSSLGEWNLLPALRVVKTPVLVIHGAADPILIESSQAWAATMPNARLLVIKDTGHIPQVEQPEILFNAVEAFLTGGWPAEAKKVQSTRVKN